MPRILKKDLEARIKVLENQVAIATEFLIETVRTAKDWQAADEILIRMGRRPVVTDEGCPPDAVWMMPRGVRRPEFYI